MTRSHWYSWGCRLGKGRTPAPSPASPRLSIVVVVFNMRREAPRTLLSLSPGHQRNVRAADYEVVVVENGSSQPLDAESVTQWGPNYRYLRIDAASPSPAGAINRGVALSQAPFVGIMIDGARIATPGIVDLALQGLQRFERAVVGTVGFHLGPDAQMYSLRHGYNQTVEDQLLADIEWPRHGYRLFDIGALAGSSPRAWLGTINESNLIFLPRALFDELGGYDERFASPGGGIVNLDFYRRACEWPDTTLITLFGEATFHQVHGGAITNQPASELPRRLQAYGEEYQRIRGQPFASPSRSPLLFGHPRPEIMPWLQKACDWAAASTVPATTVRPRPPAPSDRDNALGDPWHQQLEWRGAPGWLDAAPETSEGSVFRLLAWLGLRESQVVLELDSGSPPVGAQLVPYLRPGCYWGLEFTERSLRQAIAAAVGTELLTLKQPRFASHDAFSLDVFDDQPGFDFIVAPSFFSHAGPAAIRRCLTATRNILKPSGLLVATFHAATEDHARDREPWVYPAVRGYRWATLVGLCAEAGLHGRKLDWPDPAQTWWAVAIDPQRLL